MGEKKEKRTKEGRKERRMVGGKEDLTEIER